MRAPSPPWLPRTLVSVGAALLVLGATLRDPTRWLPGHPHSDGLKHLWSYWHTPHALASWPVTHALNAPAGGLLLDPMALPALLLAPVTAAAGPTVSANLWVFGMLVATGLGVGRLATALGAGSAGSALAAGLAVSAQPLLAYPVVCGVHERLGVALLPWLVSAMITRSRTGRGGYLEALLLAPLALHCGVWAWVGTLLMGAGLLLPRAVSLRRYGGPWAVGGVLLVLAFGVSQGWSSDPTSLAPQPGRHGLLGPGGAVVRAASLQGFFWPTAPTFVEEGDLLMRGTHLGLAAVALALVACRPRVRKAPVIWLIGACVVLAAWALGPWPFGRLNPVYAASVWVVPLLGAWPEPGQLTLPLSLFVAALAGLGWTALQPTRWRWGLLALVVVERWLALPPVHLTTDTAPDPAWTQPIAEGPVATLPRALPGHTLTPGDPFLAQIAHRQPIVASVFVGVSAWDGWSPLVDGVSEDWASVRDCLLRGGVRTLGVHTARLDDAPRVVAALEAAGGRTVATSNDWQVLDLGSPAPTQGLAPFHPKGAAPAPTGWLPPAPLPVGVHTADRTHARCPVDRFSGRASRASG